MKLAALFVIISTALGLCQSVLAQNLLNDVEPRVVLKRRLRPAVLEVRYFIDSKLGPRYKIGRGVYSENVLKSLLTERQLLDLKLKISRGEITTINVDKSGMFKMRKPGTSTSEIDIGRLDGFISRYNTNALEAIKRPIERPSIERFKFR